MMPKARRLGLGALLTAAIAAAIPSVAAADALQQNAVVNVDDVGFTPSMVTIPVGGTVTWIEKGFNVHTASSVGGAPQAFTTGGFGPFQLASLTFNTPGSYPYTSATDCLNGNNMPGFVCGTYYVVVVAPGASVSPPSGASVLPTPTPGPTPIALPSGTAAGVVTITDAGMSPPVLTIAPGSTVVWINAGSQIHTATSTDNVPLRFDSGGLGPGQSSQVTFPNAGIYTYASATDCLNGNAVPAFNCGPYSIVVQA